MPDYLPLDQQVQILFEAVKKTDQKPHTLREVSAATGISLPALSQLRSGKITNPQLSTLRALCAFFDVPLRYFDTTSREECLAIIAAGSLEQHNTESNLIATIAASLSPQGQRDLLTVIRWALAAENLSDQDGQIAVPRLNHEETNDGHG